jgi:DNA-binding transcriptional MerR regulator
LKEITEKELSKLYYSIGEVANIFEVNTSLIRFWEKEFSIIQPKKNKKGNRMFTPKDILNFNKIYHLVKVEGFTLDGAKNALKSFDFESSKLENEDKSIDKEQSNIQIEEVILKLEKIKNRLISLKTNND